MGCQVSGNLFQAGADSASTFARFMAKPGPSAGTLKGSGTPGGVSVQTCRRLVGNWKAAFVPDADLPVHQFDRTKVGGRGRGVSGICVQGCLPEFT